MQKKYIFVENTNTKTQKFEPRRNLSLINSQTRPHIDNIPAILRKSEQKFKYYVGIGNNADLIRRILSHRSNWVETNDPKTAYINFKWQQSNKGYRYDNNNNSKKGFQQMLNHFQFHEQLSNKESLLKNLMQYCEHSKKNAFELVPPTFVLNMAQSSIDTNLNTFLKFFENNLPEQMKKQNRKFWLSLNRKNVNHYSQNEKKGVFFFCKPYLSDVFLSKNSNYIWILKPTFLNRGRGIHVFNNLNNLESLINSYILGKEQIDLKKIQTEQYNVESSKIIREKPKVLNNTITNNNIIKATSFVIQKYIQRPLLINGRKFDIRVWVLWSNQNKIYFFKQGYLRTSSQQYKTDQSSLSNPFVHLTNNAIQKNNKSYCKHEPGNQLSFRVLQDIFVKHGYNFYDMLKTMKQIILYTILAVKRKINRLDRYNCFEIFGYDFMIDETSKLWLIQVNTNPCIQQSSPLLQTLLPRMLDDAFKLTLDKLFPPPIQELMAGSRYVISHYQNKQNLWQLLADLKK